MADKIKIPFLQSVPRTRLLKRVTCVNCWHEFLPEDVLWVSRHESLRGEGRLPQSSTGFEEEQKRFLAERFDVDGKAVDARGVACSEMACPRCFLTVPAPSLEIPQLIVSLLGAAGSGKSVFLASMTYRLRQLCSQVGLRIQDADLTLNAHLIEDERRMFLSGDADGHRSIKEVVEKTQVNEKRWRASFQDGRLARFVPPYTFFVAPSPNHPRAEEEQSLTGLLCLYDNAGEHFRPGATETPMTLHLSKSRGIMFTFDPTVDRRICRMLSIRTREGIGAERQDVVLIEAAKRIREHSGLASRAKIAQPLVVVLTKFDVWYRLLEETDTEIRDAALLKQYPNRSIRALSVDELERVSDICRNLLAENCPEIVAAADSVSDEVYFVPVAAVGFDVESRDGVYQYRTSEFAEITPHWVEIPLLTLLSRAAPRLVPSLRRAIRN